MKTAFKARGNYVASLAGLSILCCMGVPCEAAILVTRTETLAETFGEVESPSEGVDTWSADDNAIGLSDVMASITGDPGAMAEIAAAKGTGTADASVELLGGGRFRLAGLASVLLEQFEADGEGFGESTAQSLLDFDLTTPGQIGVVTAAIGDVALIFDPLGSADFVALVAGTPLGVGSYQLAGTAFADAVMEAEDGDQFSEVEFLVDVTIVSNGGTIVPEPSSVFAWLVFAITLGTKFAIRPSVDGKSKRNGGIGV